MEILLKSLLKQSTNDILVATSTGALRLTELQNPVAAVSPAPSFCAASRLLRNDCSKSSGVHLS
ncbi:MAG: hypothetical protein WA142_10215 [Rugosibacter sp.]